MDTPEQESTAQPVEGGSSLQDRLAGILGHELPEGYEAPEPEGQPEPVAAEEAEAEPQEVEAQAEPEAPAQDTADDSVEVEIDGGLKFKVPKELEGHILRDKDYRQKTMALAEERRSLEAVKQATQAAYQAATALGDIVAGIKATDAELSSLQQENWRELEANDPLGFLTKRQRAQELLMHRQNLISHASQAQAHISQAEEVEYHATVQANLPLIRERIKDWSPEKGKALLDGLKDYGITQENLGATKWAKWALADAAAVEILNDAIAYRNLKKSQPATANKVTAAPPVAKPGPKTPAAVNAQQEYIKARARAMKSGDTDDVVAALRAKRIRG